MPVRKVNTERGGRPFSVINVLLDIGAGGANILGRDLGVFVRNGQDTVEGSCGFLQ